MNVFLLRTAAGDNVFFPSAFCTWVEDPVEAVQGPVTGPAGSTETAGVRPTDTTRYDVSGSPTANSRALNRVGDTLQMGYLGKNGRFVGRSKITEGNP